MDADNVIALSSVVIALSAFLLSIYQGYKTRRHNELSLNPFLKFNYHSEHGIMVHLTNGGLGPAILKSIVVKDNGKNWVEVNEVFWNSYLKEFAGEIRCCCYYLSGSDILQAKEEKEILRIEMKEPTKSLLSRIDRKVDCLTFKVFFETAYGINREETSASNRRMKDNTTR